jgi:hypothetical protein
VRDVADGGNIEDLDNERGYAAAKAGEDDGNVHSMVAGRQRMLQVLTEK